MSNVKLAQPSKLVELRIASKYSLVGLEHENVCHTSLKIVKWLVLQACTGWRFHFTLLFTATVPGVAGGPDA